ncbi:Redoxin, partial [Polychaeton citri CBS 116435]
PACSATHIPGYINNKNLKDAGNVFVVSVNDAFVMKAWAESLDPDSSSGIRFLADPHGTFTSSLDLAFDEAIPIFGQPRSKRYALVIEDGKVKSAHVEPDNTGVN